MTSNSPIIHYGRHAMFCTQCGAKVTDDAVFCVHCGKKLKATRQSAPSPSGLGGSRQVNSSVAPKGPARGKGPLKKTTIAILLAVVTIAAVVAICSTLNVFGDGISPTGTQKQSPNANSQPTAQSTEKELRGASPSAPSPISYSYKTVVLERDDLTSENSPDTKLFSYPQITCSEPNETVDRLN